ncbi:glycosyltransferase [Oscillatoriales cyanobacterium LEGE 11467]|uniref:Glycosyltransferase n=1 Tax=Zarconia navalis LEGE 11467 TaxID=1828826 RepID=A0A928Z5V2_9CYAN|nr:glycosyltransferase [Zarconia navalis]MBE9039697.1 glycosyltransferase [Zarconia navalis LEGE 11467]
MPTVSVILPVYNGEKTIRSTLESVLHQTFTDFELLIINDGSIDGTVDAIESFDDSRIQVFSYENAGLSASRNRGISRATGEYLAFIDADDLWTADKLEAQFQALQDNPDAAVAYSWTDYINEAGDYIYSGSHLTVNGDALPHLLLLCFLENGSNPLIRRDALLEVGDFDETLPAAEDWDMYFRLAAKYQFACVPRPQILYRITASSMSADILQQEAACLKVLDRAFDRATQELQYLQKPSYANLYKYLTPKALQEPIEPDRARTAGRFISQIIENDPNFRVRTDLLSSALLVSATSALLEPSLANILPDNFKPTCPVKRFLDETRIDPYPTISVILPVYNGAKTIRETIESVLDQYFSDFELIIIDNGCEDNTLEVISSIQDYRIKVFSRSHAGQSASRNFGVTKAGGDYIAFIDADDLWTREKLSQQLRVLQENPEVPVVYSWVDYIDEAGEFLHSGSHSNIEEDIYAYLMLDNFLESASNPLFRRQAFIDIGRFDEDLKAAEDWDLALRFAKKSQLICIPEVQVMCRITPDALLSNIAPLESSFLTVLDRAFDRVSELAHLKPQSLGNLYRSLSARALRPPLTPSNCQATVKFLGKIITCDPSHIHSKETISSLWFNSATFALLPTISSIEKLQSELKWVFDPVELLEYNRLRPFPTISVIIPVYNGAGTIQETIESVLNQTFTDFEIVVIDDGSKDNTVDVVKSIGDYRVKVFSYANAGQGESRNRGIDRATGEYLAFIDADDLWTEDKLEKQLAALQENPHAEVAYSWVNYIDESSKFIRQGGRIEVNGDAYGHLLLTDFLENGSNPLVRREAFDEVGNFDKDLPPAEDWDMWLRLAAKYDFVCVPQAQILYRMTSTSQSTNVVRLERSCRRVLDRAFAVKKADSLQHLQPQSLANLYQYLTYKALENLQDPERAKVATRFFWTIVKNDRGFLRQRRISLMVILKSYSMAFLPESMAAALRPRIDRISYLTDLFIRIRPVPF